MKETIINNIHNSKQLEKLYRENKTSFKRAFNEVYEEIKESSVAKTWNERLNFEDENISWGTNKELFFVLALSLIAGLVAKIPQFALLNEELFYQRNIGFIVFPFLCAYVAFKQNISTKKLSIIAVSILIAVLYINFLPNNSKSNTLMLACIHLPLFLWAVLGFTFIGDDYKNNNKRIDFLRYNGDVVVLTTIIIIAGALLTGITLGLFSLIDVKIEEFYFKYIVIFGLAAAPIIGTYLVQTNPHLVNKVSPVIAKVFTPLVLVTLIAYLFAVIAKGKNPYNDRNFLLIFNMLLIGVMAIILFSITETSKNSESKFAVTILFILSFVTIIVNAIAISAILFRISTWGITPNRIAILGGNILIFINLSMVTFNLFKTIKSGKEIEQVEKSIATFLPLYCIWTMIITFIFPLLFNFK